MMITIEERAYLRNFLQDKFQLSELKLMAFDLGADAELFSPNKKDLTLDLVSYFDNRNQICLLVHEILRQRKDEKLRDLYSRLPSIEPHKKVEIFVHKDLANDVSGLCVEIAKMVGCTQEEVTVVAAAWGSIRLLISLPSELVDSLSFGEVFDDYQGYTVRTFDSLSADEQETWKYIAVNHPLTFEKYRLDPTINWDDAQKKLLRQKELRSQARDLVKELEGAVAQLDVSDKLKKIVRQIVLTNHEHGRVHYYMKSVGYEQTLSYVQRVAATYEELNPYVSKVMAGEDEVWNELFGKMQQWAFRFLLNHNFFPTKETLDLAISYASEAGGTLVQAHFPYDIPVFDAWAIQLVRNVCRKNIRNATSSSRVPYDKMTELNEALVNGEIGFSIEEWVEKGHDLNEAIKQLNPREQKVIRGIIIGLSTEEMAEQLNLKPGSIYKIKHEAIRKIRKILGLDGYNNG